MTKPSACTDWKCKGFMSSNASGLQHRPVVDLCSTMPLFCPPRNLSIPQGVYKQTSLQTPYTHPKQFPLPVFSTPAYVNDNHQISRHNLLWSFRYTYPTLPMLGLSLKVQHAPQTRHVPHTFPVAVNGITHSSKTILLPPPPHRQLLLRITSSVF